VVSVSVPVVSATVPAVSVSALMMASASVQTLLSVQALVTALVSAPQPWARQPQATPLPALQTRALHPPRR
jgi:hypothetical protein